MEMYELTARYDARQSFYGKAQVIELPNKTVLKSYDTIVAVIRDGKPMVRGDYSQTTTRHIKEFLKQNGFWVETKKDIMKFLVDDETEFELN